jgi:hypothetical protein
MKNKITSLEALEKEQRKLEMIMEVTKQEFAQNFGTNRKQLKTFLLKNVALPAGALGVGVAVTQKMTSSEVEKTESSTNADIWRKLLPIGLDLLQTYFMKMQKEKLENITNEDPIQSPNTNKLKSVA